MRRLRRAARRRAPWCWRENRPRRLCVARSSSTFSTRCWTARCAAKRRSLQQAKRLGHDLVRRMWSSWPGSTGCRAGPVRASGGEERWEGLEASIARTGTTRGGRVLWRIRNNSAEFVLPTADAGQERQLAVTLAGRTGGVWCAQGAKRYLGRGRHDPGRDRRDPPLARARRARRSCWDAACRDLVT